MDNNHREMEDLSKQIYKVIEKLTSKVKENADRNKRLYTRFDEINKSLEEHLTYIVEMQKYSKKLASKINKCAKNTNQELVDIKKKELDFLGKLKNIILTNKKYSSDSDLSLSIIDRLQKRKGFSSYKDNNRYRDQYNKDLYKELSRHR